MTPLLIVFQFFLDRVPAVATAVCRDDAVDRSCSRRWRVVVSVLCYGKGCVQNPEGFFLFYYSLSCFRVCVSCFCWYCSCCLFPGTRLNGRIRREAEKDVDGFAQQTA